MIGFENKAREQTKKLLETMYRDKIQEIKEKIKNIGLDLPHYKAIDYICHKCRGCLFYEEVDMGMDGHINICKAHEPKNFYDRAHTMAWISACDCNRDKELDDIYWRECKEFCSDSEILNKKLKELRGE